MFEHGVDLVGDRSPRIQRAQRAQRAQRPEATSQDLSSDRDTVNQASEIDCSV